MSDNFYDDFNNEPTQNIDNRSFSEDFNDTQDAVEESSYEWGSEQEDRSDGEYHYSFVNGSSTDSEHDPNRYESAYSSGTSDRGYTAAHSNNPYSSNYTAPKPQQTASSYEASAPQAEKTKRSPKYASRGFVAAALAIAILASGAVGVGGGYLISKYGDIGSSSSSNVKKGTMNVTQVSSDGRSGGDAASLSSAGSTSEIVKKAANSVVEIATEGVATGSFSRQYVTQGAGSGVIISEDGYIVTNHHVIDGANKITVTLRDGETSYDAELIGSDADNDVALIKIDATGLSPATFGNSSDLVVGDYVVAIGNPLGTLGGTVTDGIISALARQVTVEDKTLTLLQTNAEISPGNSGGGLFNANGELIGIVNAKDSATEVEGIGFAIPINNVFNIIKDLKEYGYVTGKISLGMEFVDINSDYAAFYYGVNETGVYVLSVDSGSNASKAGFKRGDMIAKVNGKEVSSEADITKALENNKVGDTVTFTVNRDGGTEEISLELAEYVPTVQPNDNDSQGFKDYQSDEFWRDFLDW